MSELAAASGTYFPGRLGFATTADIEEFVATLERYEKGELTAEEWRAFRLLRGVYHQRQTDVQMLRVKVPQGILSATQLRALALVAVRDGDGRCDVTTRQNFQFHNIRLAHIERAMYTLADVGMTTREACGNSIRTVTACPLAGVFPDEIFDVTPYADAFTRYLLRGPLSSSLPRKFKVAFEGCRRGCVRAPINDLAFVARISPSGQPGFLVLCGGGTSTLARSGGELIDFLPAEDLLSLSEAVVRVFHREGNRKNRHRAEDAAEERILDALLPAARPYPGFVGEPAANSEHSDTRQKFRKMLREGKLDDKDIEIEVAQLSAHVEMIAPPGMEELTQQIQGMFAKYGQRPEKVAQDENQRSAQADHRRRSRQIRQRRRHQARRAAQCRAKRHRLY